MANKDFTVRTVTESLYRKLKNQSKLLTTDPSLSIFLFCKSKLLSGTESTSCPIKNCLTYCSCVTKTTTFYISVWQKPLPFDCFLPIEHCSFINNNQRDIVVLGREVQNLRPREGQNRKQMNSYLKEFVLS